MYYVQVLVVDENGEQQNDALVTEFATLQEAYEAQGRANQNAFAEEGGV
jgi:hypothetical protein